MILEKMNLEEVINPQFAFPIVGVILCALLVFAFGFKTPAQPPSFDFEEVQHRKAKKKQKGKEKQIKPILNGTAPVQQKPLPVSSTTEAKPKESASKLSKSKDSAERHQSNKTESKIQAKSKKVTSASRVEVKEVAPSSEEIVGGGEWVQHVSKKERKIRRKEDGIASEAEKITVGLAGSPKTGANSPSKKKKKTGETDLTKKDEKGAAKKRVENEVVEKVEKGADIEQNAQIEQSERDNTMEIPKEDLQEVKPEPAKTTKPSKAEKKQTPVSQPEPVAVFQKAQSPAKNSKSAKGSKGQVEKDSSKKDTEVIAVVEDLKTSVDKVPEAAEASKDSTNVVFDELGDIWQDAKPQKKKKKARRE